MSYNIKSFDQIILSNKRKNKKNLKNKRIYILNNFTFETIEPFLEYYLKNKGIEPKFSYSNFNQIDQTIININSNNKIKNSDIIVLSFNLYYFYENLNYPNQFNKSDLNFFLKKIKNWITSLRLKTKSKIYVTNQFLNKETFFSYSPSDKNKYNNSDFIIKYNQELFKLIKNTDDCYLIDLFKLSSGIGLENFLDEKFSDIAMIPFSSLGQNYLANEISTVINLSLQVPKKCLVIDLDNTLWGGVLGEDGYEKIKIGEKDITSKKYLTFQKYIKLLKNRGVILAIASKNNYEDVIECFKKNKNLHLRLDDFTIKKISWNHKYKSIREIAKELNIGIDSIVFVDDSRIEKEQMKKFNPEVLTLDITEDISKSIRVIENSGAFVNYNLTNEDLSKMKKYKIQQKALSIKANFDSEKDFLKSLNMKGMLNDINKQNFDRAVQLTQKVNQFNLTNLRLSSIDFKNFLKKKNITKIFALKDKFGDHGNTGLISVVPFKNKNTWKIKIFLMSCRIIGRMAENAMMLEIINILKNKKIQFLIGEFRISKKNSLVKDLYKSFGFKKLNNTEWILDLNNKKIENKVIKIN